MLKGEQSLQSRATRNVLLGVVSILVSRFSCLGRHSGGGWKPSRNKDYQKAYREWKAAALRQGRAEAQFDLGVSCTRRVWESGGT